MFVCLLSFHTASLNCVRDVHVVRFDCWRSPQINKELGVVEELGRESEFVLFFNC